MKRGTGLRILIGVGLVITLLIATAIPLLAATDKETVENGRTVRMGFFEFGGMFEGAKEDAKKSGYCYDYMMQIATYTGWNYEFVYGSYSELYDMLKAGKIDILPYTNYNDERGTEVLFSAKELAEEEYYLVTDKGMSISLKDLNGKAISTLEGADYNSLLLDYLDENSIEAEVHYYKDLEDTWNAVRTDEADATVFTSNAYIDEGWGSICCFGKKPTYIAVSLNERELLNQLDEAAEMIDIDYPAFLGELYSQYFSDNPMRRSISAEEQDWLDAHPILHVGGFVNDAPYLYSVDNETGEATGMTVDVVEGIIERLDLGITADYRGYTSLSDMESALDSGEIDVIIPFYPSDYIAYNHNLVISKNVRVSNMEIVYKNDISYNEALTKIATPATKLGIFYVQDVFPESKVVGAVSIQDAVDKVLSGEATGAVAQNVVLHNIKEKYDDLSYNILADGCGTCFATRPENYPLIRLLNRGLNYYSTAEISAIASLYALEPNVTTRAYLATHSEAVVMLIIIFVIFLALLISLFQVSRLKKRADDANKSKTAFLFNMSHDIRTPMNAILGYTDIGLRHAGDIDRTVDSFNKIKTAGGHLLNLINDILEMSRIESGKLELAEVPMDIRDAINSTGQMSQALALSKDINFKMETGLIRTPYVYADELHLNEVLINLISNAIKYTPEGGNVEFVSEQVGEIKNGCANFRFRITDNGIGMSEEFQKHLFENFSRENTSTVSKEEGAGLGLSIVKKITDLAGGNISVKSRKDEGSTFIVEFPFKVMDKNAEEAYIFAEKKYSAQRNKITSQGFIFKGKRILLVEDNDMNREIAFDLLSDAGLMVETAEDGAIAVRMVSEHDPEYYDYILMDIQMPVMDGYEATKHIRELYPQTRIPIIALSANAFEEDRAKSIAEGMNEHVAKPIRVEELFSVMAKFSDFSDRNN